MSCGDTIMFARPTLDLAAVAVAFTIQLTISDFVDEETVVDDRPREAVLKLVK